MLFLKFVDAMKLDRGIGGEIGSGDGEVVQLEVVNEVSYGCCISANKGAKGVKWRGHVEIGDSVCGCVDRAVETSVYFVIGRAYVVFYLRLMVDLILLDLINLLLFK